MVSERGGKLVASLLPPEVVAERAGMDTEAGVGPYPLPLGEGANDELGDATNEILSAGRTASSDSVRAQRRYAKAGGETPIDSLSVRTGVPILCC